MTKRKGAFVWWNRPELRISLADPVIGLGRIKPTENTNAFINVIFVTGFHTEIGSRGDKYLQTKAGKS